MGSWIAHVLPAVPRVEQVLRVWHFVQITHKRFWVATKNNPHLVHVEVETVSVDFETGDPENAATTPPAFRVDVLADRHRRNEKKHQILCSVICGEYVFKSIDGAGLVRHFNDRNFDRRIKKIARDLEDYSPDTLMPFLSL